MPVFSIIVPTLNSSKTIGSCLDSILNQTFNDFEILIMDGLSNDNTLAIIETSKDSRIRIYSAKDKGIYDAMNKGINLAKGEWLYFLGSDDYLFYNALEKVFFAAEKNEKIDLIYGNILLEGDELPKKLKIKKYDIIRGTICHQAIFYKANLFEKLGMYSNKYLYISDWIFNVKVFLSSSKVKYINFTIAVFGTNGESNENIQITITEYNHYRKKIVSDLSMLQYISYKLHNLSRKILKAYYIV